MSAYICQPEHLAALAAFAAGQSSNDGSVIYEWSTSDYGEGTSLSPEEAAAKCAGELAKENIRSVRARYSDGDLPGPNMEAAFIIKEAERLAAHYVLHPPELRPVDILKMCSCYDYQACESDDYDSTLAKRQINWIEGKAHRQLPGYEDAIRDYEGQRDNNQRISLTALVRK